MAGKVSSDPNVFLLPDLGEGLEEAELIEWMVKPGQKVNEFDVLAKVETDKALAEVPADRSGTIAQLHGEPGQKIKVHAPFVTWQGSNGSTASPKASPPKKSEPRIEQSQPKMETVQEDREDAGTVVGAVQSAGAFEAAPGKVIATPAVRRIARDLGVDLSQITGTGIGGRVTEKDVQSFAGKAPASVAHESAPAARPPMRTSAPPVAPLPAGPATQRIPFRGVRRTIAERLRNSVNNAVHFSVMDEADVSALDETRRRLINATGEKLSFLPLVAAAVCRVISGQLGANFNKLNSTIDDANQEILQHRTVHLGIATDTENGLMVPVIRDAEKLGLIQIQRKINELAKAARERTIPREQLINGTFTISNFGSLAGRFATPIINYPECAILAIGRAREGVVVRNGMIGVGKLLPLSLVCDHRVIDGGTAATALAKIIELLQSPTDLIPAK